jgi:hypothetical protein
VGKHAKTARFLPKWKGYFSARHPFSLFLPVLFYDNLAYFKEIFAKIKYARKAERISKKEKSPEIIVLL